MATAPRIALTFDDGPGPSTPALLDVLARHGARATFFLVGKSLRGHALEGDAARALATAVRTAREGHLLGNHADSHARDPLPDAVFAAELRGTDAQLRDVYARAGVAPPARLPCRLPYGPLVRDGEATDERLGVLAALGKTHQHWTGIFGDWDPATDAATLGDALIAHARDVWTRGLVPVVALHDAGTRRRSNGFDRDATVAAVDRACAQWRAEGVRFVTVDAIDAD
jgi:chitin deacetylase